MDELLSSNCLSEWNWKKKIHFLTLRNKRPLGYQRPFYLEPKKENCIGVEELSLLGRLIPAQAPVFVITGSLIVSAREGEGTKSESNTISEVFFPTAASLLRLQCGVAAQQTKIRPTCDHVQLKKLGGHVAYRSKSSAYVSWRRQGKPRRILPECFKGRRQ